MTEVNVEAFPDRRRWAAACAERLAEGLRAALATGGRAVFAGSGGSTPGPIYDRLATADLDWSRVTVTLVDERHVPEDHPDSNAALVRRRLMAGPAAAARFAPLHAPAVTVDRAAALATRALRAEGGRLHVALLGMGDDGHICSMFPGSPTLLTLLAPGAAPAVLGVPPGRDGAPPPQERLSVNIPFLASAGRVVMALTGDKRAVFEREAAGDPAVTPVAALLASGAPVETLWTEAAP